MDEHSDWLEGPDMLAFDDDEIEDEFEDESWDDEDESDEDWEEDDEDWEDWEEEDDESYSHRRRGPPEWH